MRSLEAVLVPCLLVLALAVVGASVASAVAGVPPTSAPCVTITNTGDNLYRQVCNFALLLRAMVFREDLTLMEVVSGCVQPAGAGNNYRLLLRAKDGGGGVGRYQAVVWGVPGSREWTWKVASFQRVAGN